MRRKSDQERRGQSRRLNREGAPWLALGRGEWKLVAVPLWAFYAAWFLATPLPGQQWLMQPVTPTRLTVAAAFASPGLLAALATGQELAAGDLVRGFAEHLYGACLDRAAIGFAACLQILVAWAIGRLLLQRWLQPHPLATAAREAIYCAAGLHAVSLGTFLWGCAGWLTWPVPWRVVGLACLGWQGATWFAGRPSNLLRTLPSIDRLGSVAFAAAALPFVFLMLALAILPPTDFDVREYHLQVPKEWYQTGRIQFLPHNVYGNMPLGAEMQALCAMCWTVWDPNDRWWYGALVGKLVMAFYAVLAAMLIATLPLRGASTINGRTAGLWGAICFLSTPWVIHIAATGLNENALGLYLFLTAWFSLPPSSPTILIGKEHGPQESPITLAWAGMSGLFWGAAISIKYTALLYAFPVPCWIAYQAARSRRLIPILLVFGLASLTSGGPWYLKNFLACGNPIYPLSDSIWASGQRTAEQNQQWQRAHQVPTDSAQRRYHFSQLSHAVIQFCGKSEWQQGLVIPLSFIGFLAVFRESWRPNQRTHWHTNLHPWLWLAWSFACWWLMTHRLERFWVPLLPWLAQGAGLGSRVKLDLLWQRSLVVVGAGVLFCHWTMCASPAIRADPRWLAPLAKLRVDPTRVNPIHLYLNEHASKGDRVLLVGDAQVFDLHVPIAYNTCFDTCLLEAWLGNKTTSDQRQVLREQGITYVYYHRGEIQRYQSPGNYGYTSYVSDERFAEFERHGLLEPVKWHKAGADPLPYYGTLYRVVQTEPNR